VIIENKPGRAARAAVDYVKNANPDGSEVLLTPDFPITLYPYSFRKLSYDLLRDLAAVAPVSRSSLTFVIGPAVPEMSRCFRRRTRSPQPSRRAWNAGDRWSKPLASPPRTHKKYQAVFFGGRPGGIGNDPRLSLFI
jgi:hypothetical protein